MMRVGWRTFMRRDTETYCHLRVDNILRAELTEGKKLEDTVTELVGDEKDVFLDFASGMLQWIPEKRKTARELLQHPIFNSLNKRRVQWRA